ncbi:MAG: response regulator transcription factor [Erysipelotrichaceae bacterium]
MAVLLICDADEMIRNTIKRYGTYDGHEVVEAEDGVKALAIVQNQPIDIIITEAVLPKLDGYSVIKEIRKKSRVPIIILSYLYQQSDKVLGFEVGADDYVTKPFYPNEVMMRVKAVLSRTKGFKTFDIAHFDGLEIDYTGRIVKVDGNVINLSPKEYDLLSYLSKNNKVAISRESLLISIWGYDYYGDDRTLDTHIKLLRKSLGKYSKYISTVRGVGYRFDG